MQILNSSVLDYIDRIPEERQSIFKKLCETIQESLPKGFEIGVNFGMIGWSVPISIYPNGYHCTPGSPLPFLSLASQKNFIALYHMGLYANQNLYDWFVDKYPKHCNRKLDMGKSCIRFKYLNDIPFELIGELCSKMDPRTWIELYEYKFRK